jgi:hypothetical protein
MGLRALLNTSSTKQNVEYLTILSRYFYTLTSLKRFPSQTAASFPKQSMLFSYLKHLLRVAGTKKFSESTSYTSVHIKVAVKSLNESK